MIKNKNKSVVFLLRSGFEYHTRAFLDYDMALEEKAEFIRVTGRTPEIVMRSVNGNYIGRHLLCVKRFESALVDSELDIHTVWSHQTFFTIKDLMENSTDMKEIRDYIANHHVKHIESTEPGNEYISIPGPYFKEFLDVGKIKIYFTIYSVERIRIIKGR